jgi:predicted RNA-binding Zn-ribbon protein involved in translation (DUF1610 family)
MSREFIVSEKDGSVKKIICSACGAMVSKTDLKCPNCGEVWICAKCGAEFGEKDLKCPKCPPVQNSIAQPTESYKTSTNSQKHDSISSSLPAINKVVNVTLTGGIIGMLGGSPHGSLNKIIERENQNGWKVIQIIPSDQGNLFISILRFLVLIITLFFYTTASGYYIIMEKSK